MEMNSNGGEKCNFFNWDRLGFSLIPTDYMYTMSCSIDQKFTFSQGKLIPYGNIQLSPCSGILNYGQGLLEGLKAYKGEDNHIRLFRPAENALRMQTGAERMFMPSPSVGQFIDAVKQTALANKRWIPPAGKGSLYIRPLLMGTGPTLGLGPAPECTFLIYASPVGNYSMGPLHFLVEDNVYRAIPGGTGGIKAITNYSPVYKAILQAKAKGFSDVLFLDAVTRKTIEEASGCNIFIVKGNVISTPAVNGSVLPGITRKSIIEIALDIGYQMEERSILLEELLDADEAFCTGTAMVVNPVGSVTYHEKRINYKTGADTVSQKLLANLTGIQTGCIEDKKGWTMKID
ncbi:branched-chain-amino-acid aminotransferase 2, chloroplastic [Hevea brasiliensis]|uniref:branched-chain-amino-acid aminotransferase 2, chloroplastic n=1 Tax=Hevea brasiliensis TaxID=3981 RepID=UPI0025EC6E6A|nr:branched-chain-amino-acid aminotransferase 2, chloroplastic [Hevea brasiliensis]